MLEFMVEEASSSIEVSHLVWEASTSCNNSFQVVKQTLDERMHSPLVDMSWSSSMLIISKGNILNSLVTLETSPRQASFDLGIGFSLIFPFICPSE